ncbi:MAG: FliI/YscN family ATPase [Nitriliruptor sp.]|uniref:FliI/YscN family ATPase n=1 Tax=Nitriliruptor sp. TaxID=2448056 RepID=UPI0034A02A74
MPDLLSRMATDVRATPVTSVTGAITRVAGHEVEVRGLRLRVGDGLWVHTPDGDLSAEVVGVAPDAARALLLAETNGLGQGDRVSLRPGGAGIVVGEHLIGRVIDALGDPADGGPPIRGERVEVANAVPSAMSRRRIDAPLTTGVRAIDTLCTVGRGQRVGIFAGSGVGKSTLLGMLARGTDAEVNVLALIGERGREVREFLEDDLGPEGLARSIVVVATSDQPPLVRLRAGMVATRIAEWFADRGSDVLLMLDSLTRLATAQRDVGLAAGEPPTTRGYTPSVFTMLPRLLERAGPRPNGTITGFYTVLVDGDDMNEPVADAARSILDGHIQLDRGIAVSGRYPAIDPLGSLSRLAAKVASPPQLAAAAAARAALAAADEVRDLVEVGAYVAGTNPAADRGRALAPDLIDFLRQDVAEVAPAEASWQRLQELSRRWEAPDA